jgi:hypothetical protein
MIDKQLIAEENIEGSITYKIAEEDKNTNAFFNQIRKNFNRKSSDDKYLSPRPVEKKNVFKIKKKDELKDDKTSTGENKKINKTLLEMIKDSKSGIPMQKSKNESDYLQNKRKSSQSDNCMSRKNSIVSNDRQIMTRKMSGALNDKNYDKYFKPQLIWDPIANKMIIEKPKYSEASMKMNQEINKNIEFMDNMIPHKQHLTSSSFKKLIHTDKWTEEETDFFYKALECFGTDFSFLEIILRPRTRNQIKNKYKKEERDNKTLVDDALKKYDPSKLNKILAVVKHVKELEREQKLKKLKKSKNEKTQFDFKRIFEEIEASENVVTLKEEIQEFLKTDQIKDSDDEEESDKTVSVNYDEENENEECDNIKYKEQKKIVQEDLKDNTIKENFNMKSFYNSKVYYNSDVQVLGDNRRSSIFNEPDDAKLLKDNNQTEEEIYENKLGNIFLKQLQQFNE